MAASLEKRLVGLVGSNQRLAEASKKNESYKGFLADKQAILTNIDQDNPTEMKWAKEQIGKLAQNPNVQAGLSQENTYGHTAKQIYATTKESRGDIVGTLGEKDLIGLATKYSPTQDAESIRKLYGDIQNKNYDEHRKREREKVSSTLIAGYIDNASDEELSQSLAGEAQYAEAEFAQKNFHVKVFGKGKDKNKVIGTRFDKEKAKNYTIRMLDKFTAENDEDMYIDIATLYASQVARKQKQ